MNAVVTGATGFIGSALTKELSRQAVRVYAVGRNLKRLEELSEIEYVTAIPANHEGEFDTSHIQQVDVFYHCAHMGGFDREKQGDYALQLENVKKACDAVEIALSLGVKKFVLASSINVIELNAFHDNPSFMPRETCVYSAGKLAAEVIGKTLARKHGMEYCTAYIAMTFGERNRSHMLPNVIITQLLQGIQPRLIEGNQPYDLVYVGDVASALAAIGKSGRDFENYYVGHQHLRTFREWMVEIRDIVSPQTELLFGAYPDAPSIDYQSVDREKLYRDTGFLCGANFRDSIIKTARWLKKQEGLLS